MPSPSIRGIAHAQFAEGLQPLARMRSEGYRVSVCLSVCLSASYLTSRAINSTAKDTTYSASGIRQNVCGVFSETAAFKSYGVKTK